ncbi:DUF2922 domain-containing protein [Paenisporosarcina antarctica]|uniref:DUF2922 domain-containing protein n=1 Tax=Paenisporosarcina antarctica TaxID=417367 RepID=A0A4P7A0K5_9BACL|nr:DUF2922 domain-containing protein [Paenisporosarcina antarctica]QBP42520.1 DUF2922 domain-containing protein [Paenisporosarcina antarctica]
MAKVLEMLFDTAQGKKFTISVDEPRVDLTGPEVDSGMQALLASNVFNADGANLVSAYQARIVERNVTEL